MWKKWSVIVVSCVVGAACGSASTGSGGNSNGGNGTGGSHAVPPISQVVNNSGATLAAAKIGDVELSENLAACGGGCSTDFKEVPVGDNAISVQVAAGSAWKQIGTLGPFDAGKKYSLNLVSGGDCAELWDLADTDVPFNDNSKKTMVATSCP